MMSRKDREEQTEKLTREIAGATVRSVVPSTESEGMFTLRLEKGDKKFEVRLFATDLGWWYKLTGNRKGD